MASPAERPRPTGRPRRPASGADSGHPKMAGALVMVGVVVLLIVLAVLPLL